MRKEGRRHAAGISGLWEKIETRHQEMFNLIDGLMPEQIF